MTMDDLQETTAVGNRAEIVAAVLARAGARRPWLTVLTGGNIGRMYAFEQNQRLVVGRAADCDVHVDQVGVSRRHAMFERTVEGNVQVVDLDSKNGTVLNGERISRETLRDGDKIQIGDLTILKFSYQDELDEACQKKLYESATRDPLTQAVNRRGFDEALVREHAFARRHDRNLSAIVFDVDHFKRVNDTHGHAAGDDVLRALGRVVGTAVRREDVFARIGGEEFVLLLRDVDVRGATDCAERIRLMVERTQFASGGQSIPVTISLGVSTLKVPEHALPESLIHAADACLYRAKQSGRNRVCSSAVGETAAAHEPTECLTGRVSAVG
jgi:diguanylate cyclase (GGDEF)-like protein